MINGRLPLPVSCIARQPLAVPVLCDRRRRLILSWAVKGPEEYQHSARRPSRPQVVPLNYPLPGTLSSRRFCNHRQPAASRVSFGKSTTFSAGTRSARLSVGFPLRQAQTRLDWSEFRLDLAPNVPESETHLALVDGRPLTDVLLEYPQHFASFRWLAHFRDGAFFYGAG